MKKLKSRLKVFLLLGLIVSVSCKKDKEEDDTTDNTGNDNKNVCLVTKAISEKNVDPTDDYSREYIYDANDKILEFKDSDGENWKFSYDGDGRLIKVDYTVPDEKGSYDEYSYNSKNQVDMVKNFEEGTLKLRRKSFLSNPGSEILNRIRMNYRKTHVDKYSNRSGFELVGWSKYEYNDKGWITKEITYEAEDSTVSGEGRYTYDGSGNAIKIEFYADLTGTGNLQLAGTMTAKYGSDKSPVASVKNLPPAFLGPMGTINYLVETNISALGQEIKETYSNEVNDSKYVIKSTKSDGSIDRFEYKCK